MTSPDIRRASLAELREMRDRNEIRRGDPATEDDRLPVDFWDAAEVVPPPRTSVHLKLDPEVLDFFKRGGKGHLTRMQNVLAAYVRAKKGGRPNVTQKEHKEMGQKCCIHLLDAPAKHAPARAQ